MATKTKQKIALARIGFYALSLFRRCFGFGTSTIVWRRGIRWQLDLSEVIDLSIWLLGAFELRNLKAYSKIIKKGDTIIDIGANVGAHTLQFAKLVGPLGKVFAFEPTEFAYGKLCFNKLLNPALSTVIVAEQMLLVEKLGTPLPKSIPSSWPLRRKEITDSNHGGKQMPLSRAQGDTLDNYIARAGITTVNLVKLDVDGNEWRVIQGARQLLTEKKPVILMEVAPSYFDQDRDSFDQLIALFKSLNYKMKDSAIDKDYPLDADYLRKVIPFGAARNVILSVQ